MTDSTSARSFLTHTKLAELTKGKTAQDVVVLRQDTTVELALRVRVWTHDGSTSTLTQTLAANRILSAPVVATSETTGTGTPRISVTSEDITDVLGFVDLRDVLASFLKGMWRQEMMLHQ